MLTGEVPFEGSPAHVPRLMEPRPLVPELPATVSWSVMKCLKKELEDRFQSVTEERLQSLHLSDAGWPMEEGLASKVRAVAKSPLTVTAVSFSIRMRSGGAGRFHRCRGL